LQAIAGDLLIVAHEEAAVRNGRVIPRLAFDRLKAANFAMCVGSRLQQHGFARFGADDQQALVAEQQRLAVPVASPFPTPLAGLRIEAAKNAAIKAVSEAAVDDEIVVTRFHGA